MQKVSFEALDHIVLNAKLFRPSAEWDRQTGVLILEGSGKSGFTQEPESSPFLQLAKNLCDHGITVLTYNKRGSGENSKNGSFWRATFSSDNDDAFSALNFLKEQSRFKKIFIIGHSFGGPHTLKLSQRVPHLVQGIVFLTSTLRPVEELQLEQTQIIMQLSGTPAEQISAYQNQLKVTIESLKNGSFKCQSPSCEIIDQTEIYEGTQIPWWKEVLSLNFADWARSLQKPLLFISGGADPVIPETDAEFAKSIFSTDPNKTVLSIKELDHILTQNKTKSDSLNYMREVQKTAVFKPISQELVQNILDWLDKN